MWEGEERRREGGSEEERGDRWTETVREGRREDKVYHLLSIEAEPLSC